MSCRSWRLWWRYYIYQAFLSQPGITLCVLKTYILTFAIILPILCHQWPYSLYYLSSGSHNDLHKARNLNQKRAAQAKEYIASLDINKTCSYYGQRHESITLAIGVPTVKRNHPKMEVHYLTQVMAQLHQLFISDKNFPQKSFMLCNVHAGPGTHDEVDWLVQRFPVSHRFNSNSPADVIMDPFEKAKQDYRFCLQQLLAYKPQYVLVLEDDAVPHNNMLSVIYHVLNYRINKNSSHNSKKLGFLKLYHPERWRGYSFEWQTFLELVGLFLIGGIVFNYFTRNCKRRTSTKRTDNIIFGIGGLYFVLVALLIGRQNLLELRRLSVQLFSLVAAPDCCFPAIVYPSHVVAALVSHLSSITCSSHYPVDVAVTQYVVNSGYHGYLIEPNLVKHIGLVSATKSFSIHPEDFLF